MGWDILLCHKSDTQARCSPYDTLFAVYFVNDLETMESGTRRAGAAHSERRSGFECTLAQNSNRHLHEFVASLTIIWLDSSWRHKPLVYLLTRHEHEAYPIHSVSPALVRCFHSLFLRLAFNRWHSLSVWLSLSHTRCLPLFMSLTLAIKVYWFGYLLGAICEIIPIYRIVNAHAEWFDAVRLKAHV